MAKKAFYILDGMNNYKQKTAAKGEKLFITNFLNPQKDLIE